MSTQQTNRQKVTILGATGSIGRSTLDVLARHPEDFEVFALTANTQVEAMVKLCLEFQPVYAVMGDGQSAQQLTEQLAPLKSGVTVLSGQDALVSVASEGEVDTVMAAIVGAAGLLPTLSAVKAGKKVLLANKESLVMAGSLFMDAVAESGALLLPIDSEHNAIFQCLPGDYKTGGRALGIKKILLTGSGGPFRDWPEAEISAATPEQACKHPNWSMGRKISVDSATLMNKGLELIEACWLFDMPVADIEVLIHPQSIIHSMVEYVDGSVLAQLGNPDMRTPIAHALSWPERIDSGVSSLDMISAGRLDFESPDFQRFPALRLAIEAAKSGKGAPTVLNAANEIAVDAFLNRGISFGDIANCLANVMENIELWEPDSIESVLDLDRQSRNLALTFINHQNTGKTTAGILST